jgi:HD-GYP domain-containing protein (c-di-GMP phosphodiesterase class II)
VTGTGTLLTPGLSSGVPGGTEPLAQRLARQLIVSLHASVRAVRLYPVENSAVQKAFGELTAAVERVVQADKVAELRRVGDYLFVNETRIRLGLDNYSAVTFLQALLRDAGVGGVRLNTVPEARDWVVLMSLLQSPPRDVPEEARFELLQERLSQVGITPFELERQSSAQPVHEREPDARARARQTYVRSLDVTREVMSEARLGRSAGLKRVKRAVQGIVDMILSDPASLIGLTTLREFDEYTFVHSVNVCIFSVALGRRLGLSKVQLLDLGLSALMHDIGKSRVPLDTLNKRGTFTAADRDEMQAHTWLGVLALLAMPTGASRPWRAMVAAFEHHLRVDLTGYPRLVRPRELTLFSRIIAVADGFDAATTTRVYQAQPWAPSDVLRGMRDNARLGFDPVLVKAFINLTGIYPTGTVVVLDTFEMGIVHSTNPDATALSRPIVRLLSDAQGNMLADTVLIDLTERHADGTYFRTIIRTEDPDRYGIRLSDFFA